MAWQRDEANLGISGATAYSYTEVDWEVHGDRCTYRHIGGVTSPYNFSATATSTLQWWESGTWHDYAGPASATFNGYGDLPLVDVEDYFVRQAADRVVSLGTYTTMMGGSARSYIDYTVPHAAPAVTWAASNPVVRNSDNSITLTWNAPALEYSAMCLEVSTDGGAFSQFAVLWNTATSYEWTGCSADHSYQFRIRTNYLASYSAYDVCATVIYMTPAAPQSISTAAAGGTNITVNLDNPSPVATKVQYEVSTDDGATWGATQDSASLTSFTVSASGTVKIRVRNYNSTGTSAWLTSSTVTTICPPAKPTVTSPSGNVWDISKPLVVSWIHNPLDGSAQTAAKITLVKAGTPPVSHVETLDPFTGNSYSIDFATAQSWISGLAVGDVLNVAVKTKGADASYSSNSVARGITALTAPTLSITKPAATVTGMPIEFEATYSDMTGYTCQAATVSLTKDGRTLFSEPATINGTTITAQLDTSEFIPANGETYTVVLTARSSSSLQATANATFTTAFVPPKAATLQITNDADTGYASLLVEGAPSKTAEGTTQTFAWNQLYQCPRSGSYTENGITRVYGSANDMTFSGTPTAYGNWYINSSTWPMTFYAWHKYLLQIIPSGTPNDYVQLRFTPSSTYFSNGARIVEPSSTTSSAGVLRIWIDTQADLTDGYTVAISVYDLTAIFGSGNEPTTVDAFRATPQYQAMQSLGKLYAYDSGSTQHYSLPLDTTEGDYLQDVTIEGAAVRVVSRNLWEPTIYDGGAYNPSIGAQWTLTKSATQFTANADRTEFTITTSATWRYYTLLFKLDKTKSYYTTFTLSSTGTCGTSQVYLDADFKVIYTANTTNNPNAVSGALVPGDEAVYRAVVITNRGTASTTLTLKEPQIYEGTTAQPYTPYFDPYVLTTTGIGSVSGGSITHQALDLATTADTYADVLDGAWLAGIGEVKDVAHVGESAAIERRIGCVDLGGLTWSYGAVSSSTPYGYFRATLSVGTGGYGSPSLCAKYKNGGLTTDKSFIMGSANDIYIIDSAYTDAAAFKTAMSGVLLYYELATPTTETLDPVTFNALEVPDSVTVGAYTPTDFTVTYGDGLTDYESVSVSRINPDGTMTALLEDGQTGAGIVDKYAPLNTEYEYAVTSKSSAGAINTTLVENIIVTDLWFAYWTVKDGENAVDKIASAKWNPDNGGIQITRPLKMRVYYAGRKDPVSYDGHAVAMTETPSWIFIDKAEVDAFVKLIEDGGRGVYKSCDGWVYHADFDLTLTPKYTAIGYYGGASLFITRIAGDAL